MVLKRLVAMHLMRSVKFVHVQYNPNPNLLDIALITAME